MSHHAHTPVPVDPESLRKAQQNWTGFTMLIKYSLGVIIALLAAMALFLL